MNDTTEYSFTHWDLLAQPYSPKNMYSSLLRQLAAQFERKERSSDHMALVSLCDSFESSLLTYLRGHHRMLKVLDSQSRYRKVRQSKTTLRLYKTLELMLELQLIGLSPSDSKAYADLRAVLTRASLLR